MKKNLLLLIASVLFISCGGEQKKSNSTANESPIIGFWERVGTIQIVNGVNVDTVYWDDVEMDFTPKQIKAYAFDHTAWLSNHFRNPDEETKKYPWITGAGAFGKYTFNPESNNNDNMTENVSNIIGTSVTWSGEFPKTRNNEIANLNFSASINDGFYSQLGVRSTENDSIFQLDERTMGNSTEYAEFYKKIPDGEKTKIDGVWKHIATVRYVKGVPIDTTAVPEGLDDHKIFYKGNVIVNFDFTLAKEGDPNWGGAGLSGTYTYNKDENVLMEKFTLGTGNWMPKENEWPDTYYDIDWIDNDTYIQIFKTRAVPSEDGSGLTWVEANDETTGNLNVRVK